MMSRLTLRRKQGRKEERKEENKKRRKGERKGLLHPKQHVNPLGTARSHGQNCPGASHPHPTCPLASGDKSPSSPAQGARHLEPDATLG